MNLNQTTANNWKATISSGIPWHWMKIQLSRKLWAAKVICWHETMHSEGGHAVSDWDTQTSTVLLYNGERATEEEENHVTVNHNGYNKFIRVVWTRGCRVQMAGWDTFSLITYLIQDFPGVTRVFHPNHTCGPSALPGVQECIIHWNFHQLYAGAGVISHLC